VSKNLFAHDEHELMLAGANDRQQELSEGLEHLTKQKEVILIEIENLKAAEKLKLESPKPET